jgi:hypothetical protein
MRALMQHRNLQPWTANKPPATIEMHEEWEYLRLDCKYSHTSKRHRSRTFGIIAEYFLEINWWLKFVVFQGKRGI